MTLQLITASNAAYMVQMRPYLETLNAHAHGADCYLICLDCEPPTWLVELPNITPLRAAADTRYSPPETQSLQHGAWLDVVPGAPDDVAIFTDGDLFMQRPFSDNERQGLAEWPAEAIGTSWNNGPSESLLYEALVKLQPKVSDGDFLARWGRVTVTSQVFNVGVLVGRRATLARLRALYEAQWDAIGECLAHKARQQWLLSYVLGCHDRQEHPDDPEGFDTHILPYTFHMHYHYNLPDGALVGKAGEAYYQNQPVMFWHVPMWMRKQG